ncbi:MAG: GNAT family N-acetyltransferase [Steroidobacteraceae bacterium]|jgi:GNAT superfamily N-acetyltransferase|nr:GNAT family N-acetyltransferase [Steroidobacteraceae bacterium]
MLVIRPARPDDAPLVMELIRDLARYEKLLDDVDADESMIAAALFAPQPRVFCDVAEWTAPGRDTPVAAGFALWFYNFSTFRGRHGIYLEDLFVRPEYRGRGIGRELLVRLARRCVDEDLGRLEWAVLDWNEPALRFYASLGAAGLKEWIPHRVTGAALAALAGAATAPGGAMAPGG